MSNDSFDLKLRAHQAMLDAGFKPDFSAQVSSEVQGLMAASSPHLQDGSIQDCRALLWSSLDNDSSRDLDQIEYVERMANGALRLLIGIADVGSTVALNGALDLHAREQATSVYTGVATFPMLPVELSTDLTSLVEGEDRLAIVIELHVLQSGVVNCHDLSMAWVRNQAKLAYNATAAWLEEKGPAPAAVAGNPELATQLRLQQETSEALRGLRKQHGALTFGSADVVPVLDGEEVKDLTISGHNLAQDLIESFMVSANVAMAQFLRERGALSLRRIVRTPRRWDRIQTIAAQLGVTLPSTPDPRALADFLDKRKLADLLHFPDLSLTIVKLLGPGEYIVEHPGTEHEGHFGLAVQDYTHSTAPNRRYADLVTQRLLKAAARSGANPYTEAELTTIAAHCTEREDAARKVERRMRKVLAACLLSNRVGELFDGIVTGASVKGTYVRLLSFPAEGRVLRGAQGIDVGDKVRVRLISVDISQGFIDFERQ